MLQSVQKLRDSITKEQRVEIKDVLGDDLAQLLLTALESKTEQEAEDRLERLMAEAKNHPLKLLKLRRKLTKEQKNIVMNFMKDDE